MQGAGEVWDFAGEGVKGKIFYFISRIIGKIIGLICDKINNVYFTLTSLYLPLGIGLSEMGRSVIIFCRGFV